jgi:choline dehydrogenase-like flavoprotein
MKPFVIKEVTPGSNVTSDKDVLDFIMSNSYQNWHASCTCRMGRVNDSMAVVDSRARVIGVHGLRVVDASSFALLPPGHPQSTVCELSHLSLSCLTPCRCAAVLTVGLRSDGRKNCSRHTGHCLVS